MNTRMSHDILLVEDNPYDAELALRALGKRISANALHHVQDGAEALDFLYRRGAYESRPADREPAVMVLDLKLPKLSGLEVLQAVKSDERLKKIPVVVLTSSKEDADITAAYANGANSYVVKPLDFGALQEVVRNMEFYWSEINQPAP